MKYLYINNGLDHFIKVASLLLFVATPAPAQPASQTVISDLIAASPAQIGLQPFAPGDVFVGATQLNNPQDDHAGRGRILQYDADLNLKGLLWVEGSSHLISGLSFAPDGTLWAFDMWSWLALRVSPDGQQLENRQYLERPLSMAHFPADGSLLLSEALVADNQPLPLTTRHPPLPGEATKFGDGDIYRFNGKGELVETYDPDVHGGVTGSFAVSHSVLSADRKSLIYVSETGPRLMRYDLENARQLPDIPRNTDLQPQMHFALATLSGARLLISMGNRLDLITEKGDELRIYPLPGFGWSVIGISPNEDFAYIGNWYDGTLAKLDLKDGEFTAQTKVCIKCMASVAVNSLATGAGR